MEPYDRDVAILSSAEDVDVDEGSLRRPCNADLKLDALISQSLDQYLESQLSNDFNDHFSLVNHIIKRLRVHRSRPRGWVPRNAVEDQERSLLCDLIFYRDRNETWEQTSTARTAQEKHNPTKNFESMWLVVRKFYLRHARCVFVTTSTAGSKAVRDFKADVVILDEASQLKKVDALNAFVRLLANRRLNKLILVGDPAQLPPTILADLRSEFTEFAKVSIQSRPMKAGHPFIKLTMQYRMHKYIAELVNANFYGGELQTHPSANNRPEARKFNDWARTNGFPTHDKHSS